MNATLHVSKLFLHTMSCRRHRMFTERPLFPKRKHSGQVCKASQLLKPCLFGSSLKRIPHTPHTIQNIITLLSRGPIIRKKLRTSKRHVYASYTRMHFEA